MSSCVLKGTNNGLNDKQMYVIRESPLYCSCVQEGEPLLVGPGRDPLLAAGRLPHPHHGGEHQPQLRQLPQLRGQQRAEQQRVPRAAEEAAAREEQEQEGQEGGRSQVSRREQSSAVLGNILN